MSKRSNAAAAYVRHVLAERQLSSLRLAKMAGISGSTLTRLLNSDSYKFSLSIKTLEKVFEATGVDYAPFLAEGRGSKSIEDMLSESSHLRGLRESVSAPIVGVVCAGLWATKSAQDALHNQRRFPLLRHGHAADAQIVFEVKGNGCNEIAPDGDFLLCEKFPDELLFGPVGLCFVLERELEGQGIFETTVRRVTFENDEMLLSLPSSDDSLIDRELKISQSERKGVKVLALVRFAVRMIS